MNKVIIAIVCCLVVIVGVITAAIIIKPNSDSNTGNIVAQVSENNNEEILDDCTDEYEELMQTDSQEEKVSPHCAITIKTYYKGCGHTTEEYMQASEDMVNLNQEEVQEKYPDYQIEEFSSNSIVLYREKEGECGEHYMVKDNNGTVEVYEINENGEQELLETTGISTEYLPETDKINMQNGIEVIGKQQLNQLLEDYE